MNKINVLKTTTDLKSFFEKKQLKVCEVREVLFRLVDYIDEHFDEEDRDKMFKNGNGLNKLLNQLAPKNI